MTDILVTSPFRPFTLPTQFKAVFNGYIYCGTVDAVDPSVSQVQVYLVNESGDKVPVAQPLRTNAGGFLVYNGQPAKFVTDSNHSLLVRDSVGSQIWYEPDMSVVDPGSAIGFIFSSLSRGDGASFIGGGSYSYIRSYGGDATHIHCYGVENVFDGGFGDFYLDASDSTSGDNGGTILVDAKNRRWKRQVTCDYDWRWWGVKGDGVADDFANIEKMISAVNVFSGPSGVFAISQSLPIGEVLRVTINDNAGANAAGLIKPHSSVANPSSFDFFFADRVNVEHVNISGLRFFGGRHVIRGNFPSGVSSGFISQVNFEDCVFQELAGYVIESTNSVFVIDFHRCRLLRCGGVNIGYGVNILKFRQCGFENMRREYIKLDGDGSALPSASIGLYGCRCEGYDTTPTASKCFDIKGYGRLFNFEVTDGTYFENVFTDIGTISGVKGLNLNNLNLTNGDNRVYTLKTHLPH